MKFLIVFSCLLLACVADPTLWKDFKKTHDISYKSAREEQLRYSIFQENLRKIEEHNFRYARGEVSYFLKITQFADLTDEEFRQQFLKLTPPANTTKLAVHEQNPSVRTPDSIDWRQKNCLTGVKNQGNCGSCWAFSATAGLESHFALKYGRLNSLSEQNLLDCTNGYSNNGCSGGHVSTCFDYVKDNGIELESDYGYEGSQHDCRYDASRKSEVSVTGYVQVTDGEDNLKEAVGNVGPISVLMNAANLGHYGGGIFDYPECSTDINHAVVAVGYGNEGGVDFWTVRNSWGDGWGESGHFRLVRNKNMQCGFGYWNFYPNIA